MGDLQEDIAAKVEILATNAATEKELLPQGDKVPSDAQDYKDELNRITKYVMDLQARTKKECDSFSEDVKYWAEYRTGIKEFTPWLVKSEGSCTEGLNKPSNLDEVKALHEKVSSFDKTCVNYLKVLQAAEGAAKKMTTHEEADKEVAPSRRGTPRSRPSPTNGFPRSTPSSRSGSSSTTLSPSSTPGSPRTRPRRARTSSPSRRWSPPSANSRTSSSRRRSLSRLCKSDLEKRIIRLDLNIMLKCLVLETILGSGETHALICYLHALIEKKKKEITDLPTTHTYLS